MLELFSRARHLKSLFSSSSSLVLRRPPYAALRHAPSETLVHFAHPYRGLSSVSSFLHARRRPLLLLSLFNPFPDHFSSTPSDPAVDLQEGQKPLAPCPDHKEQESHISEKQSRFIPAKTYFLCTWIDLKSLHAQNASNVITSRITSKYVILRYYDVEIDAEVIKTGFASESSCHYMLVFSYGSVVLFNVSDHEVDNYLKIVVKHASGLLAEMRKEDFAIVEKPTLDTWMQEGFDFIVLKHCNMDEIQTIGCVLSQSIALDYWNHQVDGMMAEFIEISRSTKKTRTCRMKIKQLFQLAWKSNSDLNAVILLQLGILESPRVAGKNANYAPIRKYLWDKYELMQRFENLDFKLKFIIDNIQKTRDDHYPPDSDHEPEE
ncbi:protein RETARDED ROOT GROWTH-LIKE-like [Zingiber officinale]|uniref:protein RETARDED ROOT GROWTH-LIKE-like n=1 Tax=Zingiber officinale TaxID=94328 RepID=UPI001C4C09FB|nr:protein RETARDED ROOT GROWTH-LIKE-like [Zingiber officinale]